MKGKKAGSSGRSADLSMAEGTGVEQIVEKVVSQVLDSHVPELRGRSGAPFSKSCLRNGTGEAHWGFRRKVDRPTC
jgi:hypothetical protein